MNAQEKHSTNGAESQAAFFVARLYSGEMSRRDENELFSWLAAHPSHRTAYDEVLALWDAAGELHGDPDLVAAGTAQSGGANVGSRRVAWTAVAATLVLAIAIPTYLGWLFDRSGAGRSVAIYGTAIGEQRKVRLADGSRMMLNTGSRVLVDYGPYERRIIFEYGEVFFEIEKDPARPLTVTANQRLVTVLGTKFGIRLAGNDVRVTVVEGTVSVSAAEARFPLASSGASRSADNTGSGESPAAAERVSPGDVILHSGTMATFSGQDDLVIEQDADVIDRVQSWREGVMRFDEEPLYRVVAELNRYSRAKVLIEDHTIVNLPISGVFRVERVDVILEALEDVLPVRVVRYSDRYVLIAEIPQAEAPVRAPLKPSEGIPPQFSGNPLRN